MITGFKKKKMAKTKIEFLNTVELKVKDVAGEFVKTALVSNVSYSSQTLKTTFTVDSIEGFIAGDPVYISDGSVNSKFANILEIKTVTVEEETVLQIIFSGDFHLISAGAVIKKSDAISHIEEALLVYSRLKPIRKTHQITGSDTDTYSLPSDWSEGLSRINSIEYPIGSQPKQLLDENNVEVYLDSENHYKIRFVFSLGTGNNALLNYDILCTFTTANPPVATSPDIDFYCICNLATYYYLMGLAASSGHDVSSLIEADRVIKSSKTDAFRRLAKEYLGQAASWLGVSVKQLEGSEIEPAAASCNQGLEYNRERVTIFQR